MKTAQDGDVSIKRKRKASGNPPVETEGKSLITTTCVTSSFETSVLGLKGSFCAHVFELFSVPTG